MTGTWQTEWESKILTHGHVVINDGESGYELFPKGINGICCVGIIQKNPKGYVVLKEV